MQGNLRHISNSADGDGERGRRASERVAPERSKRWGKFRRRGSRKSLNLDCTSEMTLLPRKTSFRRKGILSSLQASKKKRERKKKRRITREGMVEQRETSTCARANGGWKWCYVAGESRDVREREKMHVAARTPPYLLRGRRYESTITWHLRADSAFTSRRRVRNVYTGFALIGQGISHRVMKGAGWARALK